MTAARADQIDDETDEEQRHARVAKVARAPRRTFTERVSPRRRIVAVTTMREKQGRNEDQEEVARATRVEDQTDEQRRDDERQRTERADLAVSVAAFRSQRLERPCIERRRDPRQAGEQDDRADDDSFERARGEENESAGRRDRARQRQRQDGPREPIGEPAPDRREGQLDGRAECGQEPDLGQCRARFHGRRPADTGTTHRVP